MCQIVDSFWLIEIVISYVWIICESNWVSLCGFRCCCCCFVYHKAMHNFEAIKQTNIPNTFNWKLSYSVEIYPFSMIASRPLVCVRFLFHPIQYIRHIFHLSAATAAVMHTMCTTLTFTRFCILFNSYIVCELLTISRARLCCSSNLQPCAVRC